MKSGKPYAATLCLAVVCALGALLLVPAIATPIHGEAQGMTQYIGLPPYGQPPQTGTAPPPTVSKPSTTVGLPVYAGGTATQNTGGAAPQRTTQDIGLPPYYKPPQAGQAPQPTISKPPTTLGLPVYAGGAP